MTQPEESRRRALLALFAGALFIALSPIFVRLSETGPTATAFWRVALSLPAFWAGLLLVPGALAATPQTLRHWPMLVVAGAAFAGDLALWHTSIGLTSIANSTLLVNIAAVLVTLASWLIWRRRPKRLFLAGLALSVAGVVLLVRASFSFSASALAGDLLGLGTAVFYAAYLLCVGVLRGRGAGTLPLMSVASFVTALVLLPLALLSGDDMIPKTAWGWATLIGLALASHAGGQGLITFALAHLPASFSAVSLLLQPVVAALIAWALFDEALGPLQLAGGAMVLAGIYLANLSARSENARRAALQEHG